MKQNKCLLLSLIIIVEVTFSHCVLGITYPLPSATNSRLVGKNLEIIVPKDNKLSLEAFAAKYQIGLSNIMEANPTIDVYLPTAGKKLIIPHQLILPDTLHEGIVINNPEMRLYYYPKALKKVVVFPIGIGELGKETPNHWITKVKRKKYGPTWTPTKKMHEEYYVYGELLPKIYPAGSDNPMGLYALYIGRLYAIHGTNTNFGIGLRVSHGCVRLRSNDIKWLFNNVPLGTRVEFINEPVKASIEPDGSRYIEIHQPLSETQAQLTSDDPIPININKKIKKVLSDVSVNSKIIEDALKCRSGIPIKLNPVGSICQ